MGGLCSGKREVVPDSGEPPLPNAALAALSRLSGTYPHGTTDRWKTIDKALREELAPPDGTSIDPFSAKQLLEMMGQIFEHRQKYVSITENALGELLRPTTDLFQDASFDECMQASLAFRMSNDVRAEGFEYGEIQLAGFFSIMHKIRVILGHFSQLPSHDTPNKKKGSGVAPAPPKPSFFDIGSGAGKVVFCALIFHDFSKSSGVEYIPDLHKIAESTLKRWNSDVALGLPGENKVDIVKFKVANVEEAAERLWLKASHLFVNGGTFPDSLMTNLAKQVKSMKQGSMAIVLSRPWTSLSPDHWVLVGKTTTDASWGTTAVYIYEHI